jgi:hypothetical protein
MHPVRSPQVAELSLELVKISDDSPQRRGERGEFKKLGDYETFIGFLRVLCGSAVNIFRSS